MENQVNKLILGHFLHGHLFPWGRNVPQINPAAAQTHNFSRNSQSSLVQIINDTTTDSWFNRNPDVLVCAAAPRLQSQTLDGVDGVIFTSTNTVRGVTSVRLTHHDSVKPIVLHHTVKTLGPES